MKTTKELGDAVTSKIGSDLRCAVRETADGQVQLTICYADKRRGGTYWTVLPTGGTFTAKTHAEVWEKFCCGSADRTMTIAERIEFLRLGLQPNGSQLQSEFKAGLGIQ